MPDCQSVLAVMPCAGAHLVYEVLKELLLHGNKISLSWIAVITYTGDGWHLSSWSGGRTVLLYGALMASQHGGVRILYGLHSLSGISDAFRWDT